MMRTLTFVALGVAALLLLCAPVAARADAAQAPIDSSPLAANGFASPSCTAQALTAQLSNAERTDCAVSGVDVAPVPLSNYAIDINIPSGLDASFGEDLYTVVQDLLVTPVWTALVWLIHVVLVALEWCYAIDLLAPATLARVSSSLGVAERVFTDPWLGLVLAVAAVGFAWQGLVRRRVLDTAGRAALLAVMVCAGLWIIADPVGTVGAVGNLADRAALSTVAASATGNPSQPVSTVDGAFAEVFDTAISGPWCYLEFGDVDWCRQPTELDPRLRATATSLEQELRAEASCHGPAPGLVQCAPGGSTLQSQLSGAATALANARTNGELFLAVPPAALARTALSGQTTTPTLYGTLCGSNDPTACTASTAPQAEFRTASGTWPRVGGLLLIVAGTLGMLLLFGFIALRLLGAALATLLYLLLAPLAVLAPALGDGGRDAFRLWLTRLVGAALAKLVYSVALGVALLVVSLLSSLSGLGWWTQWLLISVFWWTAFEQRHRLLGLVMHERGEPARRAPVATRVWLAGRGAGAAVGAVRASGRFAAGAGGRSVETIKRIRDFPQDGGTLDPGVAGRPPGGGPASASRSEERGSRRARRLEARGELATQVGRMRDVVVELPSRARGGIDDRGSPARSDVAALELRRARIATSLRTAERERDGRRVVSLRARAAAVDAALAGSRAGPQAARGGTVVGTLRTRLGRVAPAPLAAARQSRAVARVLDRAALAPPGTLLRSGVHAAPLAGLAGISPVEYLRRSPGEQRVARLEIERELARRRELLTDATVAPRGKLGATRSRAGAAARHSALPMPVPITRRARQFGSRQR
jgi:hypothetical protein